MGLFTGAPFFIKSNPVPSHHSRRVIVGLKKTNPMLQRKQTVYLFLAVVCFIACACLPLGYIVPDAMGTASTVNSIGLVDGNTGALSHPYFALPMFFLAMNAFYCFAIIFMYKKLSTQKFNCWLLINNILVTCIICAGLIYTSCIMDNEVSFKMGIGLCFPVIAIIFVFLAINGIKADINLLKSVDRIR